MKKGSKSEIFYDIERERMEIILERISLVSCAIVLVTFIIIALL